MNKTVKPITDVSGRRAGKPEPRGAAHGLTTAEIGCDEFELVISEVLSRHDLPVPAQQHLAECRVCAETVDAFEAIADSVRHLPPLESEPVSDLWPSIRATLLREGVIHANGVECSASSVKAPAPKLVQRAPLPPR